MRMQVLMASLLRRVDWIEMIEMIELIEWYNIFENNF